MVELLMLKYAAVVRYHHRGYICVVCSCDKGTYVLLNDQ